MKIFIFVLVLISATSSAAVQVVPKGHQTKSDKNTSEMQMTQKELERHFAKAVREARRDLRSNKWQDAEISGRSRAIFYSDDYSQKRAVDFKANEIQVTMPTMRKGKVLDYKEMKKVLEDTLRGLLSMNLKMAIAQDPVNRRLEELSGIRYASDLGAMGNDLILGELFRNERPSIKAIQSMAAKLTKKAYIRYPAVASLGNTLAFAFNDRTTYIVPLPERRARVKAKRYKPFIYEYANKFNLPSSLIFAIVHAESHFNPMARSQAPAFGLMQIVPHTAGRDATSMLFKRKRLLSPAYLYNPKRNVQVGTAYLHILYYRYLRGIKDPQARMYCAIAAYNAGSVNVMKTLTGLSSINKAIPAINRLSRNEVLKRLIRRMPSMETREYLNKVLNLQKTYAQL